MKTTLEPHQISWVYQHAHQHFAEECEKIELEIIRHEAFVATDPKYAAPGMHHRMQDRKEALERARDRLKTYRKVIEWCQGMVTLASETSAEQSAGAAVEAITGKKVKRKK